MKKKIGVFIIFMTLIVTMLGNTQAVQAAVKVKAPSIKVALNDDGVPVITWKKVSGATGYRVYRKTSNDTKWVTVKTTSKTKVVDTDCNAKAKSTVKYMAKAYVKANGKTTWSAESKVVSIKLPAKAEYTYKVENGYYCTYLNNKVVVKDFYGIPREFADEFKTLQDLQENGEYIFSYYYYYDEKYVYELCGNNYFWTVYEVKSNGKLEEVGCWEEWNFSPNKTDGEYYKSYEDSLEIFKEIRNKFLAGEIEFE